VPSGEDAGLASAFEAAVENIQTTQSSNVAASNTSLTVLVEAIVSLRLWIEIRFEKPVWFLLKHLAVSKKHVM